MNAEILAVGTELLLGDIVNTNAQLLAAELASLGITVLHQSVVGDNPGRLQEAVRQALARSDLLITTGGLGPTVDDITREVTAEALGLRLVLHEPSLARIRAFFDKTGRPMTENNKKQAMLPEGATVFENDWGTAPGCAVEAMGKIVVMLPGPPREMGPMFSLRVKPYLKKFSKAVYYSLNLRVFGMGESAVEAELRDLMSGANPTLAPYAKDGEVLLRITASAPTKDEAYKLCLPVRDEIRHRLGDCVYGENVENLQQVVVNKLLEKKMKIGLAESCTGGLTAKRITEVPGSSEVFECGIVSYANETKQRLLGVRKETLERHGAVSPETAAEMAEGARLASGADIGVGITGIAGPGGGTVDKPVGLVYVALSDGKLCRVRRLSLGRSNLEREYIRYVSASNALDMVRRYLDGLPQPLDCTSVPVPGGKPVKTGKPGRALPAGAAKESRWKRFLRNNIPMKGDSKRQIILKSAFLVFLVIAIVCLGILASYGVDILMSIRDNGKAKSLVTSQVGARPDGVQLKYAKLYDQNHDVRGWITIPGTNIDYVVMQSTDNDFYLRRDWLKNYSRHGVPFLDYHCNVKNLTADTIVYGHNMKDSLMFHDLTKYEDVSFYNQEPIVTFNTIYKDAQWKIFAAFITNASPANGDVFNYLIPTFANDGDFTNFITLVRERSLFNTSVDVKPGDKILTLSTCEYQFEDARMVVMARLVRPGESTAVAKGTKNPNPLMPDVWYRDFGGQKPVFDTSGHVTSMVTVSQLASAASSKSAASSSKAASSGTSKAASSKAPGSSAGGPSGVSSKGTSPSSHTSKPASEAAASSEAPKPSSKPSEVSSETAPSSVKASSDSPSSGPGSEPASKTSDGAGAGSDAA